MLRTLLALLALTITSHADDLLAGKKRILFLGDSITYAGGYVDAFELFLAVKHPDREITVIDCGLPSETVSGLSEAGHAGGKFPRPDLHERLDRVLATAKPDLVFACYGMNCGIYLPLDETRFAAYRAGVERLRAKVKAAGAEIVHLTPPVFDPLPIKARVKPADVVKDGDMFEGYDKVLMRYSEWLVEQGKKEGWRVIDTHTAMADSIASVRKVNPDFTFAKDGVHCDGAGHNVLASAIIKGLGGSFDPDVSAYDKLYSLISQRRSILSNAYLSAAGHKRPGMKAGLPLDEAHAKAAELTTKVREAAPAK